MDNKNNNTELTEDEFLKAIKEANLGNSLAQYIQKEGDRRLTEGLKTYQKNQETKNFSDSEKITNLEKELSEMKGNQSKKDIETLIKNELKAQNLNEGLIKYVKVDSNDPSLIAESVQSLKSDLLEIKQGEIDQRLKEGGTPPKGDITGPGSGMETAAREYAKKISVKEK
jgi:hypothetical protein